MARPRALRLLDANITLFADLTEEGEAPPYAQWLGEAAQHVRMPIRDFDVPTPEQMTQTLDVIDTALGTGHSVYVHCLAGLGRTSTSPDASWSKLQVGMQQGDAPGHVEQIRQ